MEDLNINRDKPDITDEQILKHRNFDAVMNTAVTTATKLPWYKAGKFWIIGGSGLVIIVTSIIIISNLNSPIKEEVVDHSETVIEDSVITSVVKEESGNLLDKGEESKEFHLKFDRIVFSPLGTAIEMPGGVYIEQSGIETEEYDVRITELTIPEGLHLSSHSQKESFKIEAYVGDEKASLYGADKILFIKEEVKILELGEDGWIELLPYEVDFIKENLIEDSATNLIEVQQRTKRCFSFGEEYQIKEKVKGFVEISDYDNIIFQPLETMPEQWYDKNMWSDVEIERLSKGKYHLFLHKDDVVKECDVEVVFEKDDLIKAQETYDNSFVVKGEIINGKSYNFYLQNGGKYIVLYP